MSRTFEGVKNRYESQRLISKRHEDGDGDGYFEQKLIERREERVQKSI